MSIEENKTLVRGFIDALFTDGDLSATDTFLAPTFVNHDPPVGVTPDAEGMRTAGSMFRRAFPDWHSELHALIAEGDIVVERFTASGTQQGELMGVAPTGKHIELQGINIFRVTDGQITERWGRLDELALMQQLGLAGLIQSDPAYCELVTVAERRRHIDRLSERCYAGLEVRALQAEVLGGLRQVMSIDAAFFATVDPATILFTSVIAEAPLGAATPLFLANEYGHDDVNKFTALAAPVVIPCDRSTRPPRAIGRRATGTSM